MTFCRIIQLKNKIIDLLNNEAQQYLGMSMTYSLFEFVKEKFDELIEEQPNEPEKLDVEKLCITDQEPQVILNISNCMQFFLYLVEH